MRAFSTAALLLLLFGVGAAACKTIDADVQTSNGGSSGDSGPTGGNGENANAGDGTATTPEDPADTTPRVRYVGRVDHSDTRGPRASWGGTRVIVRFRGSSVRAKISEHNIDGGPSEYLVIVDGVTQTNAFVPNEGENSYDLATDLDATKEHVVELYRRTESMVAITQFLGFDFPNGGELLAPPPFPNRRIEFIGDSESTGYGVECGSPEEHFAGSTENDMKAFPALVGKQLGAETHNISYSGKGVLRNQDDNDTKDLAASFYLRSIPESDASTWTFAAWKPDVVWIALGGNDWDVGASGDRPPPNIEAFKSKYAELVTLVRAKNPNAQIVCAVQGMLNDDYPVGYNAFTNAKTAIKGVVDERKASGDAKVQYHEHPRASESDLTGCDSHPNATFHKKAAAGITVKIANVMGW